MAIMTAANYLMSAQRSLDSLEQVLREGAALHRPTEQVLDRAMRYLSEARQVIASMSDEEGTE
ncbi:MAG TPA: hypothetical protein VHG88_06495 [Burkholderiales bacterium]|nr:hypothetical protein [Burkholderiales bacterium]